MKNIPIIIPALDPDERFPVLLKALQEADLAPVIIVDDGSQEKNQHYFEEAEKEYNCIILRHHVNMGKGRALKDAFNYCLNQYPDIIGCVTADSDGQHSPECIRKCMEAMVAHPDELILGCRNFDLPDVPDKSRLGNKITRKVCKIMCGVSVTDTQTGLRAIPRSFMKHLLTVEGDRFEFETNMLIETKDRVDIQEVEIQTIYDSKENHQSHFNPIKDSIRIYKLFGKIFVRFMLSSASSCVIDILMFAFFCNMLRSAYQQIYVIWATFFSRVISATCNYLINYKLVFHSTAKKHTSLGRYFILAVVQMTISAVAVFALVSILPKGTTEMLVKIPVDVVLFFFSFVIQREFVYRNQKK